MLRGPGELEEFIRTDPLCARLRLLSERAESRLVLVGGCVRDWLLGRPALDWDVIFTGDAEDLRAAVKPLLGRGAAPLDEAFGVYRLALPHGPTLDFTRQQGPTLDGDLRRRDLTMNALGIDLASGMLLDPTGGLADLAAGRIRAIARENLADDPVRLLRVYRFAATLPGRVEPTTRRWVAELAPEIARSAAERVWAELGKLLGTSEAARVVGELADVGLLSCVMAEAPAGGPARVNAVSQGFQVLHDLRDDGIRAARALAETVTGDRSARALLSATALLDHRPALVADVGRRLRWSKRELAYGDRLARGVQALPGALAGPRERFRLIKSTQDGIPALAALALSWPTVDPSDVQALLEQYWRLADHPLPRLLDGRDLIHGLHLAPGPRIAATLRALEEAQALGEITDREAALAWARERNRE